MGKSEACSHRSSVSQTRCLSLSGMSPCGSPLCHQDRGITKKKEEVAQNHFQAKVETVVLLFSMESIQVFLSFEAIL